MKGIFARIMLVLVFLALVANLVVSAVTGQSAVTLSLARVLVFGALAVANAVFAGAGVYYTTKARAKHEKSSLLWARRGFVWMIVFTAVLTISPWFFYRYDLSLDDRLFDISLLLLLTGVTAGIFTFAFYREYARAAGHHARSGHHHGERGEPDDDAGTGA